MFIDGSIPLRTCDKGTGEICNHERAIVQRNLRAGMTYMGSGARAGGEDLHCDGGEWGYSQCGYLGELTDVGQYQDMLEDLAEEVTSQGPFDGVMGFSEGGIVAATLLLEDARRPFAGFKCGIFFSAAPPLDPDAIRAGAVRCMDPDTDGVALDVPTAHIYSCRNGPAPSSTDTGGPAIPRSPLETLWSERDWSSPGDVHGALVRLCDGGEVSVHDHGHQVPGTAHPEALRGALRAINRTLERTLG